MVAILSDGTRVKSGGRTRGTPNKKTAELRAALETAAHLIGRSLPIDYDALELLQAVYKSRAFPIATRLEAAKHAIRYEKPALSAIDARVIAEVGAHIAVPVSERDPLPQPSA